MRTKFLFTTFFIFLCGFSLYAQKSLTSGSLDAIDRDEVEIDKCLSGLKSAQAPFLSGDYVVFTADPSARYTGIAFDFENYRNIHKYQLKTCYDQEYEVLSKFYVYVLKVPKGIQSFNYRMVVDGLWTTDPHNPDKIYSSREDLIVSHVDASRNILSVTEELPGGKVRFVYCGKSGQTVRLGGNFTNWDSWIYTMYEVQPGLYMIDLALPPGTYQYAYYIGMKSFVDTTNPERVWSTDGKAASQIVVN